MNILYKGYCRAFQNTLKFAAYFMPWRKPFIIEGADSVLRLPAKIIELGLNNVLIVSGKTTPKLGLLDGLIAELESVGVGYVLYSECIPDPTIEVVEDTVSKYIENNCDAFIAFGGGSPMDCVKIAAARIAKPKKSIPALKGLLKVRKKTPTIFAVPTTSGTGSETTLAAVVKDPATHAKYVITDPSIVPKYAILDPKLTIGLPQHITAQTGMDALTHAVEAYIGNNNTKNTEDMAIKAVRLIIANLKTACFDGTKISARENMQLGSFYAGVAFTKAYVGYVHSIAHTLGGFYGIAHGLANAVILPHVLLAYGTSAHKRLGRLAKAVGIEGNTNAELSQNFISMIKDLTQNIGIPDTLAGIDMDDIAEMSERAAREANPFYPVPKILSAEQLAPIYLAISK